MTAGLAVGCIVLSACSGSAGRGERAAPVVSADSTATPTDRTATLPVTHRTTWLCHPTMHTDPCDSPLTTTAVRGDGSTVEHVVTAEADPPVDCFYVYPTASEAKSDYAPLKVTPALRNVALSQAAAFSSACDVYAPVYRQRTLAGLFGGMASAPTKAERAYDDVRSAFRDYLNRHPDRRFVLIGHSQGTRQLTRLIQEMVDPDTDAAAALRGRLVAALLIGGWVQTKPGKPVGGSFQRVPLCRKPGEDGCVVAYNSYAQPPGPTAIFGRSDPTLGVVGACTSPAALAAGGSDQHPLISSDEASDYTAVVADTTFVSLPDYVTGRCRMRDGFSWLEVSVRDDPADVRANTLPERLGPDWGLHVVDVGLALGDLVAIVRRLSEL